MGFRASAFGDQLKTKVSRLKSQLSVKRPQKSPQLSSSSVSVSSSCLDSSVDISKEEMTERGDNNEPNSGAASKTNASPSPLRQSDRKLSVDAKKGSAEPEEKEATPEQSAVDIVADEIFDDDDDNLE